MIARTFATLFGLGGAVALATLLLPGDPDRFEVGIALAAAGAIATAVFMIVGYDRLPMWVFLAAPPLGTVLATGVVVYGGDEVATVYAFFYFWVIFTAFSFLSLRAGLFNLVWVSVAYAGALELLDASYPVLRWLMAATALCVAGLMIMALRGRVDALVGNLRRRVSQQDAIARIGERALATPMAGDLFDWTAQVVAETLGVDRAAVLGLPDGKSLMFRGGTGWNRDAVRSASVELDDPLAGPALLARGPILYDDVAEPLAALEPGGEPVPRSRRFRGIAASIRGPEDVLGVLVAYGTPRHAFTEADARFVQAAANVLAEAKRRQEVEEEARRQLLYDPVTERPNRTLFMDRLSEAVIRAERDGTALAVYILEIEEFKIINDSYGDLFGNALLRAFAARLRRPLYLADTVARLGGPEFAVLCEGLDAERGAVAIADQLIDAIHEPFEVAGERIRVTASAGVAVSEPAAGPKDLLARADAALYKAKTRELGGCEIFDEDLGSRLRHRVSLAQAVSEAPERGELSLAVQPIVALADGRVHASECLLRWEHPELGMIPPLEFIPVAEETGSIVAIGAWVVGEAMGMAAAMRAELGTDAPLPLHVNISPRQLAQADFVAGLRSELEASGARPEDIALEITELVLLRDEELAATVLEAVRDLGIAVVLDDFGTGYSSLSHLSRYPLDAIKIDREFVAAVDEDDSSAAIVAAIVSMGKALGLGVIAEGVETDRQAACLRGFGCPLGQGRLYAAPTSPVGLSAF